MHALPHRQPGAASCVVERLEHGEAAMPRWQVAEWLDAMERTSICGLGQAAPFPVGTRSASGRAVRAARHRDVESSSRAGARSR